MHWKLKLNIAALAIAATLLSATAAQTLPAAQPVTPAATQPSHHGSRVLVISIDGCRPDIALRSNMPNFRNLVSEGSFTFWARTTDVAITLPSHTSMITGVTPDRHTISWNDDVPEDKFH